MKQFIINGFALIGLISIVMALSPNKTNQEEIELSQHSSEAVDSLSLGTSSISLAVADIEASYAFYHKLGFEIKDGAIEQNWLILISGKTKIGLFQGMFPTNTITFNPLNARAICKHIMDQGIPINFESGFDVAKGPCTISIADPDGNPILIDQH